MKLFKKIVFLTMLLVGTVAMSACGKDTTNPVISGAVNLYVEVNSTPNYLDGISATDNKDGNVTSSIVVDSTNVDLTLLGTYQLSYSVTDESGNDACVTVFVTVVDNTLPVFSGTSNLTVEVNLSPNWLDGVTVADNYYGDITSSLTVDASAVDMTQLGTYNLVYTVLDSSDNEQTVTVTVTVVDTTAPQIVGVVDLEVEVNSTPNYLTGITATDNYNGSLTSSLTVDATAVDLTLLGTYELVYTVIDSSNNETTVIVAVVVVDTTVPEIIGAVDLEVEVNSTPNYLTGITATDNYDDNLTSSLTVDSSEANLTLLGTYDLVYTVLDSSNNETSVTVSVTVVDTTSPQILGAVDIDVEAGSIPNYYTGVAATDNYDGSLTSSIVVDDSDVDLLVLGSYDLIYSVEDASGNAGSVTVTVNVIDTTAPQILGAADTKVLFGTTPNWLDGITASDIVDGDVTSRITVNSDAVDMDVLGTYCVSYDVIDDNNNESIITIYVEVVYILPQTLIDMDIALLTELTGVAPTSEQVTLIESANVLRAENYGMTWVPSGEISPETLQNMFVRTLSEAEAQLLMNYDGFWSITLSQPTAPGIDGYDVQRIMNAFILGRLLTTAESDSLPILDTLRMYYIFSYESGTNNEFESATVAEIESVLGRSLTVDELYAVSVQRSLKNEMMGNMLCIMMTPQVGRGLTLVEIYAIKLIAGYIITLSSEGGGLPSADAAQTALGVTFSTEELAAYETIKEMYNDIMFNMVISQFETQLGREVTEEEASQLQIYIVVMFEYLAKYDEETDPEFQIATIDQIELIIERSLTEAEILSLEYINVTMTIVMIESQIGRALTETERAAVPVINALEGEYSSLYEAGVDPSMEEATDGEIEIIIGRSLTQTELDALVIYRLIMSEMPND